jgi:hypothetical protein
MSLYARKSDGKILALFGCQQNLQYWPDVVLIADDDESLVEYLQTNNFQSSFGVGPELCESP